MKEKINKKNYDKIFITTTDTLVGIGCFDYENLELIYELKKRPFDKKIIILVGSIEQARKFKNWNQQADELAKKYWPGPVSLIVNGQGFRMPNQQGLIDFLLEKGPAFVTSANLSGQNPLTFEQAIENFKEVKTAYNFGKGSNIASTIIDVGTGKKLR
ncbi:Sua5/YciO/YrdC/YwlC family protein [Mycoplasma iguanae]|uniref:L-threonylcarbamoyladenylate synthase n=1 Tax=Mycoplasma iguanae TaxID=292461 RepID=A0ABY5R7X7_9MOLU|nr:Sua5/YciO/YrdC/YwlC family protein [Mycoplasma iguanae]UVD81588.1 Sua5/YciO/YrdC/YwlC family protein [Mycoplasma iguanae]